MIKTFALAGLKCRTRVNSGEVLFSLSFYRIVLFLPYSVCIGLLVGTALVFMRISKSALASLCAQSIQEQCVGGRHAFSRVPARLVRHSKVGWCLFSLLFLPLHTLAFFHFIVFSSMKVCSFLVSFFILFFSSGKVSKGQGKRF